MDFLISLLPPFPHSRQRDRETAHIQRQAKKENAARGFLSLTRYKTPLFPPSKKKGLAFSSSGFFPLVQPSLSRSKARETKPNTCDRFHARARPPLLRTFSPRLFLIKSFPRREKVTGGRGRALRATCPSPRLRRRAAGRRQCPSATPSRATR